MSIYNAHPSRFAPVTLLATALATVLTAVASLTMPLVAQADDKPLPVQIINAMNKNFGYHKGFRANHAKGVVATGTFKPSAEAALLTKSPLYSGAISKVTVRFSDAGGLPNIADGTPQASPHGLAMKFFLDKGGETDVVVNSLKFFPVAKPEEFRDLLLATAASPATAAKPTALDTFLKAHPSVAQAVGTLGTPSSFATEEYYGINAFFFINHAGTRQAFRYLIVPEKLVHLSAEAAAKESPNYLMEDLPKRLAKGPVKFHIKAQLAEAGDAITDATKAWPDTRKVVDMGVLTLTKASADSLTAQKTLLFLPGRLTDGIQMSDDPLIEARNGAYAASYIRRQTGQ